MKNPVKHFRILITTNIYWLTLTRLDNRLTIQLMLVKHKISPLEVQNGIFLIFRVDLRASLVVKWLLFRSFYDTCGNWAGCDPKLLPLWDTESSWGSITAHRYLLYFRVDWLSCRDSGSRRRCPDFVPALGCGTILPPLNKSDELFRLHRKSITLTPEAACTALCDTWGLYERPSMLQIGYNCADTQWRQRGHKSCFMCPEGAQALRPWLNL